MKGLKVVVLGLVLAVALSGYAGATSYTGSLTTPTGITASGVWGTGGISFGWVVNDTANPGFWTYTYTLDVFDKGDTSHVIIEVSPSFTAGDIVSVSGTTDYALGTYDATSAGNSNPGMPGSMYGIKFNSPFSPTADPAIFTLVTNRAPVWGDFYAKDGNAGGAINTAWNAGFLATDPTDAPSGGSVLNHILRPDTSSITVPEPGILLLLGAGLFGLGITTRRRMKK